MRKINAIALFAVLLAACQAPEVGPLANLVSERDSLKSVIATHNERVTEINKIISESDSSFQEKLTLVEIQTVSPTRFEHFFEIYGAVETDKNVMLYPESQGLINSINVSEGDRVSKGQILANIDSQIIRGQIAELETNLLLAQTTYEKQKRLWDQKIGSEMQFLQAKSQKESLESSLATMRSQLSKAQVRAPFSGVVDEIFPNQGEMASPQMPILRIVNLKDMYIKSDVSEQHISAIVKGTPVVVEVPTLEKQLNAEVNEVSKFINPENRSFKIRVDLPSNDSDLRPNQLAHLRINDYNKDNAIVLSSSVVLQTSNGKDFVFVLEERDGKQFAKRQAVSTGMEYKGSVEIIDGLEKDTRVITLGAKSVRDGQRVRLS